MLVDDLVTQGVTEPYRMFTSRAEYRLQLREDNADARLTETGRRLGLVDDARWAAFNRKRDAVSRETERLKSTWVHPAILRPPTPSACSARRWSTSTAWPTCCAGRASGSTRSPKSRRSPARTRRLVSRETLAAELGAPLAGAVIEQLEVATKYAGYIDKQLEEVERAVHFEGLTLPAELDYAQVTALSHEVRQKLSRHRPQTLGQASRIAGVTPAAISLLLVHLRKGRFKGFAANESPASDAAA